MCLMTMCFWFVVGGCRDFSSDLGSVIAGNAGILTGLEPVHFSLALALLVCVCVIG